MSDDEMLLCIDPCAAGSLSSVVSPTPAGVPEVGSLGVWQRELGAKTERLVV